MDWASPFSPEREDALLPPDQWLCRKALFAGGVQHAVYGGLGGGYLARQDPEIFAIGGADEGSRIGILQRKDPVVAPSERHPVRGELQGKEGQGERAFAHI